MFDPMGSKMDPEVPRGIRFAGNIAEDTPLNGFIMMVNNYLDVKDFDVTYRNVRELQWWCYDNLGAPFPGDPVHQHMDLVVEYQLLLVDEN
jgi:hypothetical protein